MEYWKGETYKLRGVWVMEVFVTPKPDSSELITHRYIFPIEKGQTKILNSEFIYKKKL